MSPERPEASVNLGFALAQLNRALGSLGPTAERKAQQWKQVLAGAWEGLLHLGDRTPVAGTPAWVTLEVAQGGFATGNFAAGGPLEAHELAQLAALGLEADPGARLALNLHHLSEAGQAALLGRLKAGSYRLRQPEEGALMAIAWLREAGAHAEAEALVASLAPFFDRLRFYPLPADEALPGGDRLHLRSVGELQQALAEPERGMERVDATHESLRLWQPLHAEFAALALQAWEGPAPAYGLDPDGGLLRTPTGQPLVSGGWPQAHPDAAWRQAAQLLLGRYASLRASHRLNPAPENRKKPFFKLRALVAIWAAGEGLTPAQAWALRTSLASQRHRQGLPGEARFQARRAAAEAVLARPSLAAHRRLLARRLRDEAPEGGLVNLGPFLAPVGAEEARSLGLPEGMALHRSLPAKLKPLWAASPEALCREGVLASLDQLARLLPRLVAQAPAFAAPELQGLHQATHEAFSRRRSLLLLNLQHQVRAEELPWVAALKPWRLDAQGPSAEAKALLQRLVRLAFDHFPHRPWPNPLISQLRPLAQAAALEIPWVEELAADIFMGAFTAKFAAAARSSAQLLQGSPYAAYYGLPIPDMLALKADDKAHGKATSEGFLALCVRLNGEPPAFGNPKVNLKVLEWGQVLTTHNLAPAVAALGLEAELRAKAAEHVATCQAYLMAQARPRQEGLDAFNRHRARAQAWRQLLFFLSFATPAQQAQALADLKAAAGQLDAAGHQRLVPYLAGLAWVLKGQSLPSEAPGAPPQVLAWWRSPSAAQDQAEA